MIEILSSLNWENLINVLPWLVPFGLVLALNEWLDKITDWHREIHRKIGHVVSGLTIIFASFYLTQAEMVLFGFFAIVGALGSRVLKLDSVHDVVRKSIGTTLFAVVIVALAYIYGENRMDLLRYGILILTIPDAAAAVIGSLYGKQIPKFNKSLLGSTVFFIGTFGVTLFFIENILHVLLITIVLTVTEFFSQWGVDNLLMPIMGAWMVHFFM